MAQKRITIDVARDGSSKVEAHDFHGVGCKAATEAIELAIAGSGNNRSDPDFKDEYWQGENVSQGNYNS